MKVRRLPCTFFPRLFQRSVTFCHEKLLGDSFHKRAAQLAKDSLSFLSGFYHVRVYKSSRRVRASRQNKIATGTRRNPPTTVRSPPIVSPSVQHLVLPCCLAVARPALPWLILSGTKR